MLVELRVGNYKSFKDEQLFSMVADTDTTFADTSVFAQTENCPALLKTAAIYGANASGKSNLLKSVKFMITKLLNGTQLLFEEQSEDAFSTSESAVFVPFKLDAESFSRAGTFEFTFLHDGVRYQYGFSLDKVRVLEEWLVVYEKGYPQKWFEREYNSATGQYAYNYSKYLKGQKTVWERSTRQDALYLATATILNSEQLAFVCRIILKDFNLRYLSADSVRIDGKRLQRIKEDPVYKKMLVDFLKNADLGISGIEIIQERISSDSHIRVAEPDDEAARKADNGKFKILFIHKNAETDTEVALTLSEESAGTVKFLVLACDILDAITEGQLLLVDELENSLHPAMTKAILALFNSKDNKAAQLLFTTHSTELMSPDVFRRDQIWFVEKQDNGASEVYPLSDFSPRKNEKIAPRYLAGCYGAVPFVQKFETGQKQ